ncbi:hypothetical protein A45J_0947 [hot springs metagenome]|uniref:histidine kinase n=1 Tax=hot springs metagenome TaxID=433727 RepID=A0A5J4L2Y5_9ZZZZ
MAFDMNLKNIRFTKGLGMKMGIILVIGLFIIISIFSHLNIKLSEKRLIDMATYGATKSSISIKNAIEHAMLSGDKQIIQTIINTVGSESMVEDIKIVDAGGVVKWAKNTNEIGNMLDRTKIKSCLVCHKVGKPSRNPQTILFTKDQGKRILRNVTPIDNKAECFSCHPAENKVIGKLLIDYSITELDSITSKNRNLLIASAIATLLGTLVITMVFFNRLVGKPIGNIFDKIQQVASGNLDVQIEVKGKDEIALLGAFFNDMVYGIKTYIEREQKEHIEERLTLANIADILNRSESVEEATDLILNTLNIGFAVQKAMILYIGYDGSMQIKGTLGLTHEQAEIFKNYMEVAFNIDNYYYPIEQIGQEKGYFEIRRIKEMVLSGEIFIASGSKDIIEDFLVIPLKAANTVKGAIIVSEIKGSDISSDRAKELFSIVASAIAPHFYIGAYLDEKRQMKTGPFESFIETIREHIHKVKQYDGTLSMALIKLKNYEELCKLYGAEKAFMEINNYSLNISKVIDKVHETVRISEDRIAIILPMIAKSDAIEIIETASQTVKIENVTPEIRVVTYPDNGETAEQLICSV